MIEEGVTPSSILMVTFSKAAAVEMLGKYEKFFGANPGITFQTIHSLCFNILIREGRCKAEDVLSEEDKSDFIQTALRDYPQAEGDLFEIVKSVVNEIAAVKNNYLDIHTYDPPSIDSEMFRDLYHRYEDWKDRCGKLDFDDMLTRCCGMFRDEPSVLKKWSGHFRYIQCDEYQDTNMIQRDILYMLAKPENNLCVVGDDDQSIYRFRGARPEIMLHFTDDFPNAARIMMGTNYRSAGEIVEKSGKLIVRNKVRYKKEFVSQRGIDGAKGYTEYIRVDGKGKEMETVLELIGQRHAEGVEYKDMAVLVRTNRQSVLPVSALSAAGIPFYSIDAVKCIYDGWIFRDIRTYAELSMGIYDNEADMRRKIGSVLNKPNRFLQPALFAECDYSVSGFRQAVYPLVSGPYWKYKGALEEIETWMRLFGPDKITPNMPPSVLFERLKGANAVRYDKYLTETASFRKTDPAVYVEEMDELKEDASRFHTIREWFAHADWMSRFIKEESRKKNPNGVVIATMHRSKGLEWNTVFIIDCNDGIVPHKTSLAEDGGTEEERRLFYVAMTRAKDNLYVLNSSPGESIFVREAGLMTKEQRRLSEEIPKYLPGRAVYHKAFGEGKLVSYGPSSIIVDFPKKGRKTFRFPGAFHEGFLSYSGFC